MSAINIPQRDFDPAVTITAAEAEQAKVAQRCIMAALDHSRAHQIVVLDEAGKPFDSVPAVAVPPRVLRMFAELLGQLSQRQPVAVVPYKYELSTQEAAALLNVSRPFVVKQLETGQIRFRKVGTHRRILFEDLITYRDKSRIQSEQALNELASQGQALNLGY